MHRFASAQVVPAHYEQLLNLDEQSWNTCGSCGDSGGSGGLAKYGFDLGSNEYSEDGNDTQFWISPNAKYENGYFYQVHPAPSGALLRAEYSFDFLIPQSQENAPQAIEFQIQYDQSPCRYNGGWQADYAEGEWRTFDYVDQAWKPITIPFQRFGGGAWHHIVAEYHTDPVAHVIYFDALSIDADRHPLNISHNAFCSSSVGTKFTNAFQLDTNSDLDPYSVFVDNMNLWVTSQ